MRPTKDEYLMMMARTAKLRSTCERPSVGTGVGCVLATTTGRILATGYSGSPSGAPHCVDVGHELSDGHCIRTVHAEANAVAQAASNGMQLMGSTAYITHHPCLSCAKLLAAAGVSRVVFESSYAVDDSVVCRLVPSVRFERSAPLVRKMNCVRARGKLVVIEGIDGSGKSTLATEIATRASFVQVSEPRGTLVGDKISEMLIGAKPCSIAMTHAFIAARAQLMNDIVQPRLSAGLNVVSDRSFISSMVYQGRTTDGMLEVLEANAPLLDTYQAWPDVVVLLDIPTDIAMIRSKKSSDIGRYDAEAFEKHEARRLAYHEAMSIVASACQCEVTRINECSRDEMFMIAIRSINRAITTGRG